MKKSIFDKQMENPKFKALYNEVSKELAGDMLDFRMLRKQEASAADFSKHLKKRAKR